VLDKRLKNVFNDEQFQVSRVVDRTCTADMWPIGALTIEVGSNALRSEGTVSITFSKGRWSVKKYSGIDTVIVVNKTGVIHAKSTAHELNFRMVGSWLSISQTLKVLEVRHLIEMKLP
jgi:hypothetical protein